MRMKSDMFELKVVVLFSIWLRDLHEYLGTK